VRLPSRAPALPALGVYRYGDELLAVVAHRDPQHVEVLDHRGELRLVPGAIGSALRRVHGELAACALQAAELHRAAVVEHRQAGERERKAWLCAKWSALQLYVRLLSLLDDASKEHTR
jgi:hypothetical protein